MQAPCVQESVLRNSTTHSIPRRTSFDFDSSSASSTKSSKRGKNNNKNSMSFVSSFPSHLPSQNQSASYAQDTTPRSSTEEASIPAGSYFRNKRRATDASHSSIFSKSSKFSRISSRSSSSSDSASSNGSTKDEKEGHRARRWGRRAVDSIGRAFAAYPQGRTVGVVWYTGF